MRVEYTRTPNATAAGVDRALRARLSPDALRDYVRGFSGKYRGNIGAHPFLAGLRMVLQRQLDNAAAHKVDATVAPVCLLWQRTWRLDAVVC